MTWQIYMTSSFTKTYIMFRSCIYTLSSLLLTFLYFKTFFTKFSKFKNPADFSVSGLTGRPARSTGASIRTCMFVHVCRPTARVDRLKAVALGFSGSTARRKLCFLLEDGRPDRSTRAQRLFASWAGGRPARSTARPAKAQRLFPLLCNSEICFLDCFFWQTFSGFYRSFPEQIRLK